MGFILPGFPEETDPIQMPDIGELLCYPMFENTDCDTVRKYGTNFQKYLLDKIPLKNDRKYITVYSAVHLVYPGIRPITMNGSGDSMSEWHIDGIGEYDYQVPHERVHLLLSHCEARTEFNVHPIDFSGVPDDLPRGEFCKIFRRHLRAHPSFESRVIHADRFYSFSNHIHRATNPKWIQFRYTLRVRETDREEPLIWRDREGILQAVTANALGTVPVPNIERKRGAVKVYIPDELLFMRGEELHVKT